MTFDEIRKQTDALKKDLDTKRRVWGYIQFEIPKLIKQYQRQELEKLRDELHDMMVKAVSAYKAYKTSEMINDDNDEAHEKLLKDIERLHENLSNLSQETVLYHANSEGNTNYNSQQDLEIAQTHAENVLKSEENYQSMLSELESQGFTVTTEKNDQGVVTSSTIKDESKNVHVVHNRENSSITLNDYDKSNEQSVDATTHVVMKCVESQIMDNQLLSPKKDNHEIKLSKCDPKVDMNHFLTQFMTKCSINEKLTNMRLDLLKDNENYTLTIGPRNTLEKKTPLNNNSNLFQKFSENYEKSMLEANYPTPTPHAKLDNFSR